VDLVVGLCVDIHDHSYNKRSENSMSKYTFPSAQCAYFNKFVIYEMSLFKRPGGQINQKK
jgi:hypothetical protein